MSYTYEVKTATLVGSAAQSMSAGPLNMMLETVNAAISSINDTTAILRKHSDGLFGVAAPGPEGVTAEVASSGVINEIMNALNKLDEANRILGVEAIRGCKLFYE